MSGSHVCQDDTSWLQRRAPAAAHPTVAGTTALGPVNASNQLPGITGGATFTYDATGDRTSDGTRTYTYDAEGDGHILTATGPGLVASTRYDPFGRRYSKTVNGVTTVYDDDPEGRVIADYDGSGHVLRLYGYLGAATAPVVVMTPTGAMNGDNPVMNVVYNHFGRLGSVVATSANGALVGSFSYTPFGESLGNPEQTGTEFGFAGYQFDAETGLYHTQNRYYDPRLGRFLSPDPLGQAAGRNVYAYVGGDPLDQTDPSGLCFEDACVVEGIGAGVLYAGASALVAAGVCIETCGSIIQSINSAAASIFNSAPPLPPGVGPGPFAGPSVPAGPSPRPTAGQQEAINAAGAQAGCHTCGTTDPGTQSGNWIGDHQPLTALNPAGNPQVYLPQCQGCSNTQGGLVRGLTNKFEAPSLK